MRPFRRPRQLRFTVFSLRLTLNHGRGHQTWSMLWLYVYVLFLGEHKSSTSILLIACEGHSRANISNRAAERNLMSMPKAEQCLNVDWKDLFVPGHWWNGAGGGYHVYKLQRLEYTHSLPFIVGMELSANTLYSSVLVSQRRDRVRGLCFRGMLQSKAPIYAMWGGGADWWA